MTNTIWLRVNSSSVRRKNTRMARFNSRKVNFVQRCVARYDSLRDLLRHRMLAPVQVPHVFLCVNWTDLSSLKVTGHDIWNSVSVDGYFTFSCVEGVKVDLTVVLLPRLFLLLSETRVMFVVVKQSLLCRHLNACRHKVETLVQGRSQLRVLFVHLRCAHNALTVWTTYARNPTLRVGRWRSFLLFWSHLYRG